MRAVIICNGSINDYEYIKSKIHPDDYIICADGGYIHAMKMNIKPDIVIGDLDSSPEIEDVSIMKYPVRKDYTDGEISIRYAMDNGYDDILILGATGDRMDHTMTDIFLLTLCKNGCLIDDNNEIYLIRNHLEVYGKKGDTVSILPINGDLEGITTEGLEYPLKNETLYFGKSRGVSNVMENDTCCIETARGLGLLIKVRNI